MSRVVAPASKLSTVSWWADTTLGTDLDVAAVSADDVYATMDWLVARQDAVEAVKRSVLQWRFIDGVAAKVMDISNEGVRLEIVNVSAAVLPPFFTLRVPGFGVAAKVKRVWVATPAQGSMWCGGILERPSQKTTTAWNKFVANAPGHSAQILEIRAML